MGEYAKRLSDGVEIKIGTCNNMYYCRYDQIDQIDYDYPTDNLNWRIPALEEDDVKVGEFEYGGLYKNHDFGSGVKSRYLLTSVMLRDFPKDSELAGIADDVGNVQAEIKPLGMYLNVPCHHGLKLPENTGGIRPFFNGKRNPLHLCFLKNTKTELLIGIRCIACNNMWTCSFNEIEPYIFDEDMKLRLLKQCSDYYFEHNSECPEYKATEKNERNHAVSILLIGENYWRVLYNDKIAMEGSWDECVKEFHYYLRYADRQKEGGEE